MFLRFFPGEEAKAKTFSSSLPGDELSMAQLQGHFLKYYFMSAEDCVSNASLLVSESKPKGKSKIPVYNYLRRSGLEEWSATFMLQGKYFEDDLRSSSLSTVSDIFHGYNAMMLDLDYEARNRMAKLLKQDELYMTQQHAFADLSDIREAFLSAYINQSTGKEAEFSDDLNIDEYLSDYQENASEIGIKCSFSALRGGKKCISPLMLEKLSRKLCAVLSADGKGIVSRYQLHNLIDSFPNRPVECVLAAYGLHRSNGKNVPQTPELSLAQLWKSRLATGGHLVDPTSYQPFDKTSPTASMDLSLIHISEPTRPY